MSCLSRGRALITSCMELVAGDPQQPNGRWRLNEALLAERIDELFLAYDKQTQPIPSPGGPETDPQGPLTKPIPMCKDILAHVFDDEPSGNPT